MRGLLAKLGIIPEPGAKRADLVAPPEPATPAGDAAELLNANENRARHEYPVLRLLATVICLSMALNVALAGALVWMFPLQRVDPWILQVHPHGRMVVDLQPLTGANLPTAIVVLEGIIERYVIEREEVIEIADEMQRRWTHPYSYIATHTERGLFEAFKKTALERLNTFARQPYRSIVEIEDIIRVSANAWTWRVLFTVTSSLGSVQRSTEDMSYWEATIRMQRSSRVLKERNVWEARRNPFGFYVVGYDLRPQKRLEPRGQDNEQSG